MKYKLTILIILMGLFAHAQDSFNSERPGLTRNAYNIPAHGFQLEAGFNFTGFPLIDDDVDQSFTTPSLMLRYGVLNFLELRFENSYEIRRPYNNDDRNGFTDLKFGFKANLRGVGDYITNYAIIGYITLPKDDPTIGFSKHTGGLTFAITQLWSDKWQSSANLGAIRDENSIYHLVYSFSTFYKMNKKFALFAEIYANDFTPEYSDSRIETSWHFGASYLLGESVKLDAFIGSIGANSDPSLNIGASWRL